LAKINKKISDGIAASVAPAATTAAVGPYKLDIRS